MLEIIVFSILGFFIGYHIGVVRSMIKLREFIIKEAKNNGIILEHNAINDIEVQHLFVEKIDDVMYLYEREKNTFICQGSSIEELAILANKRNNIKYAAVMNGDTVYAFVNGEVKLEL